MDSKINNILRTKEDIFFVDEKNIVELKEIAKNINEKTKRSEALD
jgi:hypothetical protein